MRSRVFVVKSRTQLAYLAVGIFFLLTLILTISIRSQQRKSVLGAGGQLDADAGVFVSSGAAGSSGTRLLLRDFRRVEVRDGLPVWEVKAKDAQYFARDLMTHVNDAALKIYRKNGASIDVRSQGAKLHMTQESIGRAELEGSIVVELDNSLVVETDLAVYHAKAGKITAPGKVKITGSGFEVRGVGMRLDIEEQIVKLLEEVYSYFESKAGGVGSVRMPADIF